MSKIVIIEENEFARVALQRVLVEKQLDSECVVTGSHDAVDGVCLVIKSPESDALFDIQVKSDQFDKPLRVGLLLDRIYKHFMVIDGGHTPHVLVIGPYELDCQHNVLTEIESQEIIRLTDKETHILRYMYEHEGGFVERSILLDEVWGYAESVETHTLETHIYRLRQKIEKDPTNPALLVTTEQGYVLNK